MKSTQRSESDWLKFKQEWGMHYQNAKHILAYMNSYPKVLSTLRIEEIHNPDNLDDAQIEWIWLCSKFDNILEIDFFKPYWIPLEVNSYDHFMDISDENYPIFDINYFFYEPYRWYKKFVSEDIRDILLSPDTGLDLKKILDKNDKIRWRLVGEFFNERRRLGYEGKITVEPVNHFEIIPEGSKPSKVRIKVTETSVSIHEINSIIAGLLPFDLNICLKYIYYKHGKQYERLGEVKCIKDLVFLLRDSGSRRVERYRIDFPDSANCFLTYKNESCTVHLSNKLLINEFIVALNTLINKE